MLFRSWAKRVEWEKLKDRGDYFTARGMPEKAVPIYKKALADSRQVRLLNNLAVALMHMERYAECAALFREAIEKEPGNNELKLNYAEACIYSGKISEAKAMLEDQPASAAAFRLFGELYDREGDAGNARMNLRAAAGPGAPDDNIYRLTDFYIKAREFDSALTTLSRVKNQDARAAVKRAEICAAQSDFTQAAEILEKALITWPYDTELLLALSEYSRKKADIERADQAIARALALQPDSARAKLEAVKVKLAQNSIREYQEALRRLINNLKNDYRDAEEAAI